MEQASALEIINNKEPEHEPYEGVFFAHDKPIRKDYYVSRLRAMRECYRQRRNFMEFLLDHPSQRETHKIDSNSLLKWLGLYES